MFSNWGLFEQLIINFCGQLFFSGRILTGKVFLSFYADRQKIDFLVYALGCGALFFLQVYPNGTFLGPTTWPQLHLPTS